MCIVQCGSAPEDVPNSAHRPGWVILAAAFVLWWCGGATAVAQLGLPVGVQMMVDEAEENFFDGDFGSAERCIRDAEGWLEKPPNKRDLARLGVDHSMVKAMLAGLRAEILFARGEQARALSSLQTAEQTLRNRRKHYVVRGMFPEFMWQYEAFLAFVRGDLVRSTPDFGLAEDPGVPAEIKQLALKMGDSQQAMAAYRNAEAIMGTPMAQQRGDGRRFDRLEGRLFTSLARLKVLKAGTPTAQDIMDAQSFLERAEAAFARDEFWKRCIKQEHFGEIPNAFKDVAGTEADPAKKLSLKRRFSQTIHDWVAVQLLRVELAAFQEQADAAAIDTAVTSAEQRYDRIIGFLKAQYTPTHPRVQEVRASRARWLLALSRSPTAAPETRVSWLRDCLHELEGVTSLSAGEMAQKQIIELVARRRMLQLNESLSVLDEEEKKRCVARVHELTDHLEKLALPGGTVAASAAEDAAAEPDETEQNVEPVAAGVP